MGRQWVIEDSSRDEYPEWIYNQDIWDKTSFNLSKSKSKLMKEYFFKIYPKTLANTGIHTEAFKRTIINALVSMEPKTWDDPDWEELGQNKNIGVVGVFGLVRKIAKKYVPKDKWHDMEAVCNILRKKYVADVKRTSTKHRTSKNKLKENTSNEQGNDTNANTLFDSEVDEGASSPEQKPDGKDVNDVNEGESLGKPGYPTDELGEIDMDMTLAADSCSNTNTNISRTDDNGEEVLETSSTELERHDNKTKNEFRGIEKNPNSALNVNELPLSPNRNSNKKKMKKLMNSSKSNKSVALNDGVLECNDKPPVRDCNNLVGHQKDTRKRKNEGGKLLTELDDFGQIVDRPPIPKTQETHLTEDMRDQREIELHLDSDSDQGDRQLQHETADEYPARAHSPPVKLSTKSDTRKNKLMRQHIYQNPVRATDSLEKSVIKELIQMEPETWEDPDWNKLGKWEDLGVVGVYALVQDVTMKYVPKEKWGDMKAVCAVLKEEYLRKKRKKSSRRSDSNTDDEDGMEPSILIEKEAEESNLQASQSPVAEPTHRKSEVAALPNPVLKKKKTESINCSPHKRSLEQRSDETENHIIDKVGEQSGGKPHTPLFVATSQSEEPCRNKVALQNTREFEASQMEVGLPAESLDENRPIVFQALLTDLAKTTTPKKRRSDPNESLEGRKETILSKVKRDLLKKKDVLNLSTSRGGSLAQTDRIHSESIDSILHTSPSKPGRREQGKSSLELMEKRALSALENEKDDPSISPKQISPYVSTDYQNKNSPDVFPADKRPKKLLNDEVPVAIPETPNDLSPELFSIPQPDEGKNIASESPATPKKTLNSERPDAVLEEIRQDGLSADQDSRSPAENRADNLSRLEPIAQSSAYSNRERSLPIRSPETEFQDSPSKNRLVDSNSSTKSKKRQQRSQNDIESWLETKYIESIQEHLQEDSYDYLATGDPVIQSGPDNCKESTFSSHQVMGEQQSANLYNTGIDLSPRKSLVRNKLLNPLEDNTGGSAVISMIGTGVNAGNSHQSAVVHRITPPLRERLRKKNNPGVSSQAKNVFPIFLQPLKNAPQPSASSPPGTRQNKAKKASSDKTKITPPLKKSRPIKPRPARKRRTKR